MKTSFSNHPTVILLLGISVLMLVGSGTALAYSPHHAILGWDGDQDAVFGYMTGGFHICDSDPNAPQQPNCDYRDVDVTFGVYNNPATLQWYNESGYLPCLTTQFAYDSFLFVKIMNFADKVTIGGNDYVVVYSRVSIYNRDSRSAHTLCPGPSPQLVPLPPVPNNCSIPPGATVNFDYVIAADKFGNTYNWPSNSDLAGSGSWDTHYAHMASYWNNKLAGIVNITQLPDPTLINAYKAGYIYTHIVKDGYSLRVGEDAYDKPNRFDHDVTGILANLLSIGDFTDSQTFLANLRLLNADTQDAKYKYPWLWAIYLEKTGNSIFVDSHFNDLWTAAHNVISADRTGPGGIIKSTSDLDNPGYWTMDNWSALMGLTAYKYICNKLGNHPTEVTWATNEYNSLLAAVNTTLAATMDSSDIDYIPLSMLESNILRDPKDASWATMLHFGRWTWDGYLFGANQTGVSLTNIDNTYDAGFLAGWAAGLPQHDFGAFPGFGSAYNAGSASAALRGERYRSEGIYGYQFMIAYGQTGPFCWRESFREPAPNPWGPLQHPDPVLYYNDDCPHMWGQANATKVLIDSLISEKADGGVIIGRGTPNAWVATGKVTELSNFPIANNNRMGFKLEGVQSGQVRLTLTGSTPAGGAVLDLRAFKNNIQSVTAGTPNNAEGTVTLAPGILTTTVTLINPNPTPIPTPTPLPTVSPPPVGGTLIEAESGTRTGCYLEDDPNASGGWRVDGIDAPGDNVAFSNFPGTSIVRIRYASPNTGNFGLYVSGARVASIPITPTGPAPQGWNIFAEKTVNVNIPANVAVKFQFDSGDVAINLDYVITGLIEMESGALAGGATPTPDYYASAGYSVVIPAGGSASFTNFPATNVLALRYSTNTTTTMNLSVNNGPPQTVTLSQTRGPGGSTNAYADQVVDVNIPAGAAVRFQGVTGSAWCDCINLAKKAEAENAVLTGCNVVADPFASPFGPNGRRVDGINAPGDNVKFTSVQGGSNLAFRYAASGDGLMSLYINNELRAYIFFPSTGSWGGTDTSFKDKVLGIYTPPGAEVRLQYDNGDRPVNLDYIRTY